MNARSRYGLIALFALTGVGLVWKILIGPDLAPRLLAMALLLLGVDQMRMAIVDLDNIQSVRSMSEWADDSRLQRFDWITRSTILMELLGFALASYQLGWGGLLVLLSQIWFNLQAGIQLNPNTVSPIADFGILDRAVVLCADVMGIGLISCFFVQRFRLISGSGLLAMVIIYFAVKYIPAFITSET